MLPAPSFPLVRSKYTCVSYLCTHPLFFPPIFSFHLKCLLLLGASPSWKTEILVFWFLKDFTPLVITVFLHHQDLFLLGLSYYIQPFSKFYKSPLIFIYSFSHCTFVWLHSKSFLLNELLNHPICISPCNRIYEHLVDPNGNECSRVTWRDGSENWKNIKDQDFSVLVSCFVWSFMSAPFFTWV